MKVEVLTFISLLLGVEVLFQASSFVACEVGGVCSTWIGHNGVSLALNEL